MAEQGLMEVTLLQDEYKTKSQLLSELTELRQRVAESEMLKTDFVSAAAGQADQWAEATEKPSREALRTSETRYRRLFEAAQDGILILDADTGQITDVNPFLTELLGYSHEDLVGKALWEIGPFKNVEASQTAFAELQSKEYIRYEDLPLETSGGRRIDVEFVSNIYLVERKKVIQCNIRDITERKQAQEALRYYVEQLATHNAELDAFAHTVAHDLKNPISIIIGFAEVLVNDHETMPPEALAESLRCVSRTGVKLNTIVEELMLLAGVCKQEVVPQPLDMGSIVREAIERVQILIQDRHAQISLCNEAAWPEVVGYAPWIEEVWANYVSNAIKYGGRPPHVAVGADPLPNLLRPTGEGRAGTARFWVRDNGPGLSVEAQTALFNPFTRLDQVRANGHGLGLSIVRRIADKLGGQVGLESELGQGSTFFFTLPTREWALAGACSGRLACP